MVLQPRHRRDVQLRGRHRRRLGGDRHELLLAHQLVEQLGVVDDLVVAVELRVLAAEGVHAVRARGDDLARARLAALEDGVEHLLGLHGHHLEEELVARAPRRVAGAALLLAEHDVVHVGDVQQLGDRAHRLLGVVVERAGAADEEQVLGLGGELAVELRHVEGQVLRPVHARGVVLAPGVALVLQVAEQDAQLGRELRLDHDLVAAHVDDVVDVLDVDRALLDARAAGGAGPEDVRVDDAERLRVADERAGGLQDVGAAVALVARLRDAVGRRGPGCPRRPGWRRPRRACPCRRSCTAPSRTCGRAGP